MYGDFDEDEDPDFEPEWSSFDDHADDAECPFCGVRVQQVASATMSLALWQHVNWVCRKATLP